MFPHINKNKNPHKAYSNNLCGDFCLVKLWNRYPLIPILSKRKFRILK